MIGERMIENIIRNGVDHYRCRLVGGMVVLPVGLPPARPSEFEVEFFDASNVRIEGTAEEMDMVWILWYCDRQMQMSAGLVEFEDSDLNVCDPQYSSCLDCPWFGLDCGDEGQGDNDFPCLGGVCNLSGNVISDVNVLSNCRFLLCARKKEERILEGFYQLLNDRLGLGC